MITPAATAVLTILLVAYEYGWIVVVVGLPAADSVDVTAAAEITDGMPEMLSFVLPSV